MKTTLLFTTLLLMVSITHAGASYSVVNLATTKQSGIDTFDFRSVHKQGRVSLYYSLGLIASKKLSPRLPSLTLGLGVQLPWQRQAPWFYGVGGYLVVEEKTCNAGNSNQRAECLNRQAGGQIDGGGNHFIIQPEAGLRFKISNDIWFVGSLRYWLSNSKTLDNELGLSLGAQF